MVEAACHRCGREWDYTGQSEHYGTCPNCKTSVKLSCHPESARERAEPSETAERCPDPSERGDLEELYDLLEAQGNALGEVVQESEEQTDRLNELAAEVEELDEQREAAVEVAAVVEELVEGMGGSVGWEHVNTDGPARDGESGSTVAEVAQNLEVDP